MATFFTSDQHFDHKNIIKYCHRPFANVDEMNEALVEKHNAIVTNYDTVYHLGDFCFSGKGKSWLDRLNGRKHILIKGNHDHNHSLSFFDEIYDVRKVKIGADSVWLSHYAHLVWPQAHYGVYHLFGHSHGNLKGMPGSLDCGVDSHGFMPIPWEDLRDVMDNERDMLK
jgi:calcineurin-like phosphoesterase family protein